MSQFWSSLSAFARPASRRRRAAHSKKASRTQQRSARQRSFQLERLETRSLLAVLVGDVIGGTKGTTVSGTIYEDVNADGVRNNGENGLADWTVYLDLDHSGTLNTDATGTLEPSALTNKDGDYVLDRLKPGNYRVSEVIPDGWKATSPVSQDVTVVKGKDALAEFFVFGGGTVEGVVWSDQNQDGVRDPEDAGLAGWNVFLDLDQSGGIDPGEPVTTTASDGSYVFHDVPPGDYEVTEVLPDGWLVSGKYDTHQTVSVSALQTSTQDFANYSSVSGALQGSIWNDANVDGVRNIDPDTGDYVEPGLEGWTVYLDLDGSGDWSTDGLGNWEPSAVTDAQGDYVFIGLAAGNYQLSQVIPDGWYISPEFDAVQNVSVDVGSTTTAFDFADFTVLNGSVDGVVWNDLNRNGVRDTDLAGAPTEPGLAGWTVFLDRNRNKIADEGEPITTTASDGTYVFTDLQVGEYEVREIVPTGWETTLGYGDNYTVNVFSGMNSTAHDFGNYNASTAAPGTVSGVVWNDLDGDGVRDVDASTGAFTDVGLAGWTVFLDQNANNSLDAGEPQSTTATDGSYLFTNVPAGTIRVMDVLPTGWRSTAPATPVQSFALRSGQDAVGVDFGNAELQDSSISGVVFADGNHNGTRDTGERGLSGITVYLDLNDNGALDAGEPNVATSSDQFYTPDVNEAGTYSFTHLSKGTYVVRAIVPETLSATPAPELVHTVTITSAQNVTNVNTAAVFRANEIHGVKFEDVDGDHVRDAGEPVVADTTVFVDLDRDNVLDAGEPTTVTAADGSYTFKDLAPGAYVVREVVRAGYDHSYPSTTGGVLWPAGVSNAAVGNVSPGSITLSLAPGESSLQHVSLTLPNSGALTNLVDVFLLFDDTGSFTNNSPIVRGAFPDIISQLQTSLPGIDLGFGVGRLEEYANYAWEYSTGRPFVLNQPIVAASTTGYLAAIQAALDRTTPGYGGDQPETDIEALYQLVTGLGFDGNNNGSVLDSGAAGLANTQLNPGDSGDVPSFASFQADPSANVLPAAGSIGGGGFRAGALPIVLLATDTGFAYQPKGETSITGLGGKSLPLSSFTETSRPDTPFSSGAGLQETVTGLNALGALVIGLGTNPESTLDPRQGLEALSTLTGATNQSTTTIDNGTADPIAPGDPFYFQIASGFASSVANGVVSAIQNAVTNVAVNITIQASDPRVKIVNHTGVASNVGAGQTAGFDIEFVGDGVPHRFDLQFVRAGTNVVLGSIPVVLGTPVPGDGYEFEDLEDGEIELHADFGDHQSGVTANTPPTAVGDSYSTPEDVTLVVSATNGVLANDSDADGDPLTATLKSGPTHGSLSFHADGSFTYTPAADFHGPDAFTYVVNDGSANSSEATVSLDVTSVNDAPVAAGDAYSTSEDAAITVSSANGVLANDNDIDGDVLTATLVSGPSHGSLSLNSNGSFTYTPAANYHGADSFTYVANDGTADSAEVTVSLDVASVNNAPVAAGDAYSTSEDAALTVSTANGVLANDHDVDGDSLTVTLVSGPSHGSLTLNADGSFTYAPAANYHGADAFTYVANDGTVDSAAVTVSLDVTSVNDAPLAAGDAYSTSEDATLTVSTANGVLANDNDVDGDSLTATLVSGPTHGSLTLHSDGSFTYTPSANYFGADRFTYVANDGTADSVEVTVSLSVTPVNDLPIANGNSYVVDANTSLTVATPGILANDNDVDGDTLVASLVTGPSHGSLTLNADGSFIYTPAANYSGTDSFTYVANDGLGNSLPATVGITVRAVGGATKFFVVDSNAHGTFEYDAAGTLVASRLLNREDQKPRGIASNKPGTMVWVLDENSVVFVYDNQGRKLGSWEAKGIGKPQGIATDGRSIWIVDADSDKVFYFADAASRLSGTAKPSNSVALAAGNKNPTDIATDGRNLWVVNDTKVTDAVFRYTVGGKLTGSWTIDSANSAPTGVTIDPTNVNDIWIVDNGTDSVYRYAGAANRLSGAQAASSVFALAAGDLDPQGIVDPNTVERMQSASKATSSSVVEPPAASETAARATLHAADATVARVRDSVIASTSPTNWFALSARDKAFADLTTAKARTKPELRADLHDLVDELFEHHL